MALTFMMGSEVGRWIGAKEIMSTGGMMRMRSHGHRRIKKPGHPSDEQKRKHVRMAMKKQPLMHLGFYLNAI
jgi:hypothetical protein